MFRVGMKVAYTGGQTSYNTAYGVGNNGGVGWPSCINTMGTYTIRDVDTRGAVYGWPIVLRFDEFITEAHYECGLGIWEPGFPGDCFRPVVARKTDISCLQALLVPGAKILDGVNG
jgi:hypothetical protein